MFKGLLIRVVILFAPKTRRYYNYMFRRNIDLTPQEQNSYLSEDLGQLLVMSRYFEATRNIIVLLLVVVLLIKTYVGG